MNLLIPLLVALGVLVLSGTYLGSMLLRIRRQRHRPIVQSLAAIVGQDLPLGPALRAVAANERGLMKRSYESLALLTEQGVPLSHALQSVVTSCPARVTTALQAAENSGTTRTILRDLAAEIRTAASMPVSTAAPTLYSFAMLGTLAVILVLLLVRIVPRFRDIFRDFNTQLPVLTELMLHIVASPVWWMVFSGLTAGMLALLSLHLWRRRIAPTRLPPLLARLHDALTWFMPGLRGVMQSEALARQLPVLQAALRAGDDLSDAAAQAAIVDANYWAQARLARWAQALRRGEDLTRSASSAGLPAPLVRAVGSSRNGDDLATALEYLALYYRSLLFHWRQVVISAALPAMVLCWAVIVALIAVSLFLPLVTLIQAASASIG